ncbi:PREDICTED: putative E3 ubiquitin-protein ligase XBAT35 isoform X2 [Theobroma cacao]|uniref:E3 ubiquitin-protein ligase XBAT35 isoform X2 n=2 Tax=Theobroma cacao TaxID=3641 RepID=A0AB32VBS7_THECC|nr:PREDICTED: putative E3 ubiquitin-protein ligase XBAT35 isoform X2 [Theobroma cacao]EOY06059.1 XB3 in, putative isoform 2 [Theobroma cacao]
MGQQQSKGELLYNQVNYGNTEGIKALCREGAGLEWIDREGKTPLILACLNPELFNVAKTLIELGANVNAYRPGRHAGTPLHHAAKRGLQNTVKVLLSHGANPLALNDDCQTPLDVARVKGHVNVVRAIEDHICLFSGWMREFYGPGFIEMFAPQLVSRKVWVAVLPTGSRNQTKPFKLELAIYSSLQDAQPRTIIPLWRANLEEPKLNQPDPSVAILDNSTKTRIKLAPEYENDRQKLQWFCDACKGIPQATGPAFLHNSQPPAAQATAPQDAEDLELAMAISASIQSAIAETPNFNLHSGNEAGSSTSWSSSVSASNHSGSVAAMASTPSKASISEWSMTEPGSGSNSTEGTGIHNNNISAVHKTVQTSDSVPSAPPAANEIIEDDPIQYPSIDSSPIDMSFSPIDMSSSNIESVPASADQTKEDEVPSSCVICLDAPSEAACVPCGHVAGCMSCLNEIKAKKWGCPVCRTKIEQVIRLYRV